jgi:hypothetical protein
MEYFQVRQTRNELKRKGEEDVLLDTGKIIKQHGIQVDKDLVPFLPAREALRRMVNRRRALAVDDSVVSILIGFIRQYH